MALEGLKVLEFVGLGPALFCGRILSDFGATVTRIDKSYENDKDNMKCGKRTLAVNLKHPRGQELVRKLSLEYDVIIDPFRPGVMEKLKLGPEILCKDNPRLVYARLTGFGQTGPLAQRAGHDINYAAYSGVLSMLRYRDGPPFSPFNLLAEFAGGSLLCALGICIALLERQRSGRGQVVDAAMIDGAAYAASWLFRSRHLRYWDLKMFEGGAFYYDVYETKDNKFLSVGALEPKMFNALKERLGLPHLEQAHGNENLKKEMRKLLVNKFKEKTQAEWILAFQDIEAGVFPVVEWREVMEHEHHRQRSSFEIINGLPHPRPAPRFSRTSGVLRDGESNDPVKDAMDVLKDIKMDGMKLQELSEAGVISLPNAAAKL